MKKILAAFAVSAVITWPVFASPQGSWPEDMRGYSLPKQNWIMIIPATRQADGSVSVWNRTDAWNREWVVPKATPVGTRTVAVNGDSEDMRIVSPPQIDNMSVSSLSRLAGKYGASAIAVVVAEDGGGVAVAAWAKGNYATWDTAIEDGGARRDAALRALDEIYSGSGSLAAAGEGAIEEGVEIIGQRMNETLGRMEYRIQGDIDMLARIEESGTFTVTSRNENVPPSIDVVVNDGRDVEQALFGAGIRLR
nr:hypothetical protein [Neorhizobium tomejilense]